MKVSIIVPIYNSETYLKKCIESLINQTYQNIEIILINDGSSDNSQEIIDEFVSKDQRVKAFKKENSGVSDTRNIGISEAAGEFFLFVDSDDFIDLDYVDKSVKYIEDNNLDYLKCSYIEKNGAKENRINYYQNKIFTKNEIIVEISETDNFSSIGGVFVKKGIIIDNNIRFSKDYKFGEDMFFNYCVLVSSNKVGYLSTCNYYYVSNSGSVSSNISVDSLYKYFLDNLSVILKLDKVSEKNKANKILKKINIITKKYVFSKKSKFKTYKKILKKMLDNENVKKLIVSAKLSVVRENKFNKINMFFLLKKCYFFSYAYLKFCFIFKK